ncbi:unnamed protein product [Microthlaspi erraticum]|uniref:F-box domain-containing protein n=1 Tax=Microthlaspi erraticum TaxID=1685480 RepID=A0A6D2HMA7_9BRAS|nr:unnamed protein product [Microthlaspi erraticum]CAA7051457.1 unnamed protein product [Microthlaspi erraticum]
MTTRGDVAPAIDWIGFQLALSAIELGILAGHNNWRHLPTELKMKILESLPGVDIARAACVCREIRDLDSDNDLWKQKFLEEFADRVRDEETEAADDLDVDWKDKFACLWRLKRRLRRGRVSCNPTFATDWFGARNWDRRSGSSAALRVLKRRV